MFDYLKEAKVLQRNNSFQGSYNVKYFEEVRRLMSLQKAKEPKQASTMELFCDDTLHLTIFAIKPPPKMFNWFINSSMKIWKFSK